MNLGLQVRVATALVCFTVITIIYFVTNDENIRMGIYGGFNLRIVHTKPVAPNLPHEEASRDGYLVWGPNCRLQDLDPWDVSIRRLVKPTTEVICSKDPPLTYIERRKGVGNVLKIDEGMRDRYKRLNKVQDIKCCFSNVKRVEQSSNNFTSAADNKVEIQPCNEFDNEIQLTNETEFILVTCKGLDFIKRKPRKIYEDMHALVPMLPTISSRLKPLNETTQEKLSVIILGIDSVSRLNLRRTMPQTLSFLQRNKWVELHGYNKIADNTFPNLMAILSGQNLEQIKTQCYQNRTRSMNACPLIWNDFHEHGYVTAYAEDVPTIGTFNYMQRGFVEKPTDYYMRPFMVAAHEHLPLKKKDELVVCVGPVSVADHIFKYAKHIAETFEDNNYFGLFWINSFSHNNVNSAGALDVRLMKFLTEFTQLELHQNTLIFLLSDHGMRFGTIRETFIGYLEERLPFLFMWVPKWFKQKYPDKYKNLITNKNRLTTPYDVYMTLQDVLKASQYTPIPSKGCPKCKSLFEKQDWDRSCEDAGVEEHWCTCFNYQQIDVQDLTVMKLSRFLYKKILTRTKDTIEVEKMQDDICADWEFSRTVNAYKNIPYSDSNNEVSKSEIYVIVIELSPAHSLFEATIKIIFGKKDQNDEVKLLGYISRLDPYFHKSKCVKTSPLLKFYCHCTV